MRYVREAGGFYYSVDDYGHREPINMSLGIEAVDSIIEGLPIAMKISLLIFKFMYWVSLILRNLVVLPEDAGKWMAIDAKLRKSYGSGFIGSLIAIQMISFFIYFNAGVFIYSIGKHIVSAIKSICKSASSKKATCA